MFKHLLKGLGKQPESQAVSTDAGCRTLSDYQLAAKAAGDKIDFLVDLDRLPVAAEALILEITRYFQSFDKADFRVYPVNPALRQYAESVNDQNWAGSPPKIQWLDRAPDTAAVGPHMVDVAELLGRNSRDGLPVWAVLYGEYLAFTEPLSMYENQAVSKKYDSVAALDQADATSLSTFNNAYDAHFLKFMDEMGVRSVLDLGCGAGAFRHLLAMRYGAGIGYRGYDYARTQIHTAIHNFGAADFDVMDISNVPTEEYNRYDAVHCYSVLPFMSRQKQLKTLNAMLASTSRIFIELTVTRPGEGFMPNAFFKNFSKMAQDGMKVMTPVTFLDETEVHALIAPYADRYSVHTLPIAYNTKYLDNDGGLEEPILVSAAHHKQHVKKPPADCQALTLAIVPKDWETTAGPYRISHAEDIAAQQELIKTYFSQMTVK